MSDVMLCQGNALRLPLRDACVQCVVTSPPYWNLRMYLGADSPLKAQELGGEARHDCLAWARNEPPCETPCYICQMRRVFAECYRVLRMDGTLWINIADSYNAAGRTGHGARTGYKQGTNRASATGADACRPTTPGLKEKDLCGIPHRLALALQSDGLYWRSEIIWHKPNPMPESVTDRPTKAHEQVLLFSKQPHYFWDGEAVKEQGSGRIPGNIVPQKGVGMPGFEIRGGLFAAQQRPQDVRSCRSVWSIASEGFVGAHFATMPTALASRCILAGSSTRCCPQCYTPYARQVEREPGFVAKREYTQGLRGRRTGAALDTDYRGIGYLRQVTTGFTPTCPCITQALADGCRDSQHMDWLTTPVPSLVLDPFSGSGTVPLTARALGRHGVGVELSWEYLTLSRERLGLAALARWQDTTDDTPGTTTYEGLPLFAATEGNTL